MEDAASPSWGSLPLERYVLAQWESKKDLDPDERRRVLTQEFVCIGEATRCERLLAVQDPATAGELPPEAEWADILSPLRSQSQRQMCVPWAFGVADAFGVVWLRTCYDDNAAYAQLFDRLNAEMALDDERNVLDDPALYDLGEDWRQIFNVIPEKLLLMTSDVSESLTIATERKENIHIMQDHLTVGKLPNASTIEMIDQGNSASRTPEQQSEYEKAADVFKAETSSLHDWCQISYLYVADKTALETGKVLVVFFDDCGRTVRSTRIDPNQGEGLAGACLDPGLAEQADFAEAEVGRDYMPGGVCGPPFKSS